MVSPLTFINFIAHEHRHSIRRAHDDFRQIYGGVGMGVGALALISVLALGNVMCRFSSDTALILRLDIDSGHTFGREHASFCGPGSSSSVLSAPFWSSSSCREGALLFHVLTQVSPSIIQSAGVKSVSLRCPCGPSGTAIFCSHVHVLPTCLCHGFVLTIAPGKTRSNGNAITEVNSGLRPLKRGTEGRLLSRPHFAPPALRT